MNKTLLIVCVALLCGLPCLSHARKQETTTLAPGTDAGAVVIAPTPGQPVTLGSRTIFTINSIQGYAARERASIISGRVASIAENPRIEPASITTVGYDRPMTIIKAGNELLMVVYAEDARALGLTQEELAARWTRDMRAAIVSYRQEHGSTWIMAGALKALAATLVFLIAVFVLRKGYRKADAFFQGLLGRRKVSIHIQSFELVKAERIGVFISGVLRTTRLALGLFLLYAYVHIVMRSFPWTSAYASEILRFVIRPFHSIGLAVWEQIPNLFFAAVIFLVAFYANKLLRMFFAEVEKGVVTLESFHPEWALPTYKICRLFVIIIALIMAFPYIPGSSSPAFKGVSIFLGVLISLGSSSTITNILAGYSLIYRRAFKVGDRVKIADFTGDVMELRLEVTHLRTVKNEEIVVPNSMIISSHVINYSSLAAQKGLILHTSVTIGYDAPWRQIHALLLLAAGRTPGLLREPAPFILQKSLDDFYVTYELNVYCDTPLKMARLYSDLHQNIQDAFNEYGVQIMSPWYRFDPGKPKVVPKDMWHAAPAKPPDPGGESGSGRKDEPKLFQD